MRGQQPGLKNHAQLQGAGVEVTQSLGAESEHHEQPESSRRRPADASPGTARPATHQDMASMREAMRHVVSGQRLLAAFSKADPLRQGQLCPRDFVQVIRGLGVPPQRVFSLVGGPAVADLSQASIDYVAFVEALSPYLQHRQHTPERAPYRTGRRHLDAPTSSADAGGVADRECAVDRCAMPSHTPTRAPIAPTRRTCARSRRTGRPATATGSDAAAGLERDRIGAQASPMPACHFLRPLCTAGDR
jgi:hypothetical protein